MLFYIMFCNFSSYVSYSRFNNQRIVVSEGFLAVISSFFRSLSSSKGGAIEVFGVTENVLIEKSSFCNCSSNSEGGAIHVSLNGGCLGFRFLCGFMCYTGNTDIFLGGQFCYTNVGETSEQFFEFMELSYCFNSDFQQQRSTQLVIGGICQYKSSNNSNCRIYHMSSIMFYITQKSEISYSNICKCESSFRLVLTFNIGKGGANYCNILQNRVNEYGVVHITQGFEATLKNCVLIDNEYYTFDLYASTLSLYDCCVNPYTFCRGTATVSNVTTSNCVLMKQENQDINLCRDVSTHHISHNSLFPKMLLLFLCY